LALVLVRSPFAWCKSRKRFRLQFPRDTVRTPARDPAVFVHRAVSQDLEILLRVPRGSFGIIERGKKTCAVHRHLRDAIDFLRLRHANSFQNGWCNVSTMSELTAQAAFVLNAFWPGNDHWVTNAAEMGGHLLSPLKGRVPCPRPRRCIVRIQVGPPPFLQAAVSFDRF